MEGFVRLRVTFLIILPLGPLPEPGVRGLEEQQRRTDVWMQMVRFVLGLV